MLVNRTASKIILKMNLGHVCEIFLIGFIEGRRLILNISSNIQRERGVCRGKWVDARLVQRRV